MKFKANYIIISGIIMLFSITLFSCKKIKTEYPHDLNDVLDAERLAVISDSSSMGFASLGDSVYGFQYEIIKAFADTLGVELQITKQNDLNESIKSLQKGECDIIANIIPVTTEYKKKLLFSKTLLTTRLMLVQRIQKDTAEKIIKTQTDLANDTIFLPYNSPYKMRIMNLSDEIADSIHIVEIKNISQEDLIKMVSEGKIKNTICLEHFSRKYLIRYQNLDFSLPLGFSQNYSWAVHASSTKLMNELNDFLDDFIGSSAYWKLYRKYF
jgi:membrane-bound lytic murein transglycosylase F